MSGWNDADTWGAQSIKKNERMRLDLQRESAEAAPEKTLKLELHHYWLILKNYKNIGEI